MEQLVNDLVGTVKSLQSTITLLHDNNDKFQSAISKLERDNYTLRQDLAVLQKNTGSLFTLFSRFPAEIRRMIWHYACTLPQLHIMGDTMTGRSKISSITNACKEARAVAISLRLDAFVISSDDAGKTMSQPIKNYVNLDIDTFWLDESADGFDIFTEDIRWLCGRRSGDADCHFGHCCRVRYNIPRRPNILTRIAVHYSTWPTVLDYEFDLICNAEMLNRCGTSEILLVVGNTFFDMDRDVKLLTPQKSPAYVMGLQYSTTWPELAEDQAECLRDFKENQFADKQAAIDNGDVHFNQVDEETKSLWGNLDHWELPKIRFVEAVQKPSQGF